MPRTIRDWDVRTTALQRLPGARSYSRALLPLMPWAFQRLDFSSYDVVITTSSAFSKNIAAPPGAVNLCYCHTPPRYLWDLADDYVPSGIVRHALAPVRDWLRVADLDAASRVHRFIANSHHVAERIHRIYRRDATVVYPPVDTARLRPNGRPPEDFYLVVARLAAYKRIDLAIEACNRLGRRLLIVGSGPALRALRSIAGPTVQFVGALEDAAAGDLYARCRAFLFPGLEDFGIAAVEAQAAGRPVIAYARGGAAETVCDGVTGVHFANQSVDSLVEALRRFESLDFHPTACRANAERFDAAIFRARIDTLVRESLSSA
jgi:glycosyltransferase involved in cell wall biosynthesis